MNINRPDLNLLVVFDAISRTGSVSRAAESLALSQPAVSHALNRLRHTTGDALFVRNRGRLAPTPFAESLRDQVAAIVDQARAALTPPRFDPATATRTYRIGVSEYAALTIAPILARTLIEAAPAALLEFAAIGEATLDALSSGTLDAAFWGAEPPGAPFEAAELFRERFVVVTAQDHPVARAAGTNGRMALDAYLDHPHARVAIAGSSPSPVDVALGRLGLERRIVATAPGFASLLALLDRTPLIATAPSRLALSDVGRRFATFPLPFDAPPFSYWLLWHRRRSGDAAHRWLRTMIEKSLAAN